MASIEYVNISITRTSSPAGHACGIEYSYYLHTDKDEYDSNSHYTVGCVLVGNDIIHHKTLGDPPYDVHSVRSHESMPVKRHFMVPCVVLNEAWGRDNIFIKVIVTKPDGSSIVAKSEVVSDWF